MIGPGAGVRVYLACGVTDMRRGITGLAALAQEVLRQNPASGAVFAFRGRRGDRIKLLHWHGRGRLSFIMPLQSTLRSSPQGVMTEVSGPWRLSAAVGSAVCDYSRERPEA
jgi:hypothetical protein